MDKQKIKMVESWPKKSGKADYLKFLHGERLTQQKSIRAMCYQCCCGSPEVCSVKHCPLAPYNVALLGKGDSVMTCGSPDSE